MYKKKKLIILLKDFIRNNPPLDKDGKPTWWSTENWLEHLDNLIPNWRELLNYPEAWEEIKGIKPRRNYDNLLKIILRYAPPEKLIEYLESEDVIEYNCAYKILIEDNAKKLTSHLWKLLKTDTKIWLISKIVDEVFEGSCLKFLRKMDVLHDPKSFFERITRQGYILWIYPYIIPLLVTETIFCEEMVILHPLWIRVKSVIEQANDLFSMRKIEELERKFKELFQRTFAGLQPLLQCSFLGKDSPVSKNVLFDPSLLLDDRKIIKTLNFMKMYHGKFNFFILSSFYRILRSNDTKSFKVMAFFEYKEKIYPEEILRMLDRFKRYFTLFEIPLGPYREKYSLFYKNLSKEIEDHYLAEILFEEWIFLQEFSWIVAESKKTFEKFKEAGAVAIELYEKAVDKLIRRTLKKKDDDFINTFDKLRALGKWIAVGSSSATSLLNPLVATFVSLGTGIFLLLDPKNDF